MTYEILTSRQNPTVKAAAALATRKGREEAHAFLAEGEKLTYEALQAGLPIEKILLSADRADQLLPRLQTHLAHRTEAPVPVLCLAPEAFAKVSTERAPQGMISIIKYLDFFQRMDIIYKEDFVNRQQERMILLCGVRDPGNLGSIVRSAVAFGVEHILLSDDCADWYNPKTVRSAMGSLFRVRMTAVSDMPSLISALQACGRRVFAAELTEGARPLGSVGMRRSDVVMIGNEGHGIPPGISALCDASLYIPISKRTESLNAAVAAAVFMWEQERLTL